jgi:SAM-dependent methyltransferase
VGDTGHVVGVDMTPEMVAKATANRAKAAVENVEFRLGEIEHLPVADASVDVVMSNCVINLSPDKPAVFREAFRVLAPGGRLAISDVVAVSAIPADLRDDLAAHTACVAGAAPLDDIRRMLADAGFDDVRIDVATQSRALVEGWVPGRAAGDYVASALIRAVKPVTPSGAPCCDSTLVGRCCTPDDQSDRS